ncbi:hypothetical protein [Parasphingorhabdus sp.]|uniref:hypothetical protein n=1 Tax=Parasphingorhabdus sp. TaxID=2709688 RepID=UPI003A94E61E
MLIWDYLLPGSIIMLKFGLRMTTDQETNGADTLKAIMVFPVDIAFLSLSYGSAILYTSEISTATTIPVKAVLTTAFIAIALLLPVIVVSKKSERALVLAKTKKASLLAALGYFLALTITAVSVSIDGML